MQMRWMLVAVTTLVAVTAPPAAAQTLSGTWVLDTERSQTPEDALMAARGAAGGAMAVRGGGGGGGGGGVMIRRDGPGGGIMGVLQGGQRLHIEQTADQVTIRLDESAPVLLPLNGAATQVTRWEQQVSARARLDGDTLTVETTLENGGVVTETFTAVDGELTFELRMPLPVMGAGAQPPTVTLRRVYTPSGSP